MVSKDDEYKVVLSCGKMKNYYTPSKGEEYHT